MPRWKTECSAQYGFFRQTPRNQVTQMRSKRNGMPEVVIPAHQLAKQPALLVSAHQFQLQPSHIVSGSRDHSPRIAAFGFWHFRPASHWAACPFVWQHQQTARIELLQKLSALSGLQ